jgi:hypothetical protein
MGERDRSRLVLIATGVVVAVLVGVAVVIALQPPPVFDPTTPEGTAQGYFQALHDGDDALVISYLTDDLTERGQTICDDSLNLEDFMSREQREATSVSIISTKIDGDSARVELSITVTYGEGPFDAGTDRFDETLVMEHHADRWLISELAWPWDRYSCEREG